MQCSTPPSPKQLSSELVHREVEELYDLYLNALPTLVEGGAENAVWHLRTDKGDWLAKVFVPGGKQLERVTGETALYEYLGKQGIQVPRVLKSRRVRPVENIRTGVYAYPVMVMKYEDLRFTSPSTVQREELVKIAQTVARMHQCLKHYPCSENLMTPDKATRDGSVIALAKKCIRAAARRCRPFKGASRAANFMIYDEPVGYDTLAVSRNASAFTPEEHAHMRLLDRRIKDFLSAPRPLHLAESVIHGDLALEHTPFLLSGDIYLFDFSDYSRGSVAEELGTMFVHLYIDDEITYDRWEELKDSIVTAYSAVSSLSLEDIAAISSFTMRNLLLGISYRFHLLGIAGANPCLDNIWRRYQLAEYLLQTAA